MLFRSNLKEVYNKLCKVATKDAMSVELGLKKIASLELEMKILLGKLFDTNDLLNNVKTENMFLLDKVKNLELELFVTREQTDRSASSKLDHMLSVQKSLSDKTGLGFVESISVPAPHSTKFVPSSSSKPHVSEVVKPSLSKAKSVEVTPPRKISVDLQESKPKAHNPLKGKLHDKPTWVCHFCGKFGHIHPNCFKLRSEEHTSELQSP